MRRSVIGQWLVLACCIHFSGQSQAQDLHGSWAADLEMRGSHTENRAKPNRRPARRGDDLGEALFGPRPAQPTGEPIRVVLYRDVDGEMLFEMAEFCRAKLVPAVDDRRGRDTQGLAAYTLEYPTGKTAWNCIPGRIRRTAEVIVYLRESGENWDLVLHKQWSEDPQMGIQAGEAQGSASLRPLKDVWQVMVRDGWGAIDHPRPEGSGRHRAPGDQDANRRIEGMARKAPPPDNNQIQQLEPLIAWLDQGCRQPDEFYNELRSRLTPSPNNDPLTALMATSLMSENKRAALVGLSLLDEGNLCDMRARAEQCRDLGGPENHAKRCDCAVTGMSEPRTGQFASLLNANRHIASVSCPIARDAAKDDRTRARLIVQDIYASGAKDREDFDRRIAEAERLGYAYGDARRARRAASDIEARMQSFPPLSGDEYHRRRKEALQLAEKIRSRLPGSAAAVAIHIDMMDRATKQFQQVHSALSQLFASPSVSEQIDAQTKGALDQEAYMRWEREQRAYGNSR